MPTKADHYRASASGLPVNSEIGRASSWEVSKGEIQKYRRETDKRLEQRYYLVDMKRQTISGTCFKSLCRIRKKGSQNFERGRTYVVGIGKKEGGSLATGDSSGGCRAAIEGDYRRNRAP